jgi:hypothetical protein
MPCASCLGRRAARFTRRSRFSRPFGEAIRYQIQSNVVLKECLETRERPSESLS